MGQFSGRRGPTARAETEAEQQAVCAFALAYVGMHAEIDAAAMRRVEDVVLCLPSFRATGRDALRAPLEGAARELSERGAYAVLQDAKGVLPTDLRHVAFVLSVRVANADGPMCDRAQGVLVALAQMLDLPTDVSVRLFAEAFVDLRPNPVKPAKDAPFSQVRDTRKSGETPSFDAYILLSEPLSFSTADVRRAVLEDYPGLAIAPRAPGDGDIACNTAEAINAPVFPLQGGADACRATLLRTLEGGDWGGAVLSERQRRHVPDLDLRLLRQACYLRVSVGAKSTSLMDAFRAARLASCLAAGFARLPVTLAVYWDKADHFLGPLQAIEMADQAMEETWPCASWLSLDVRTAPMGEALSTQIVSKGLASFMTYEMMHMFAPVSSERATSAVMSATWMALQAGHSFLDGEVLGKTGQSPEPTYSVRHVPRSVFGSSTDLLALIHPAGSFDAHGVLGKPKARPQPGARGLTGSTQPDGFRLRMRSAQRLN